MRIFLSESSDSKGWRGTLCLALLLSALLSCRAIEDWLFPKSRCIEGDPHPSDAVLVENFRKNRESFDLLLEMLREDQSVMGLDREKRLLTNGKALPADRVADYKRIAEELGFCMGFRSSSEGSHLEAHVSAAGMVFNGSTKGYEYTTEDLSRYLVESLDGMTSGYYLRSLGSNWYLVLFSD